MYKRRIFVSTIPLCCGYTNQRTDNKMVGKAKIQTTQKLKIGQHDPQ